MTHRQRTLTETILIAVGLLACALFIWHKGDVRLPSYLLFMLGAITGFMGFVLRLTETTQPTSRWLALPILTLIPLFWGLMGGLAGLWWESYVGPIPAYGVLAAYGIMIFAIVMNRHPMLARAGR